MVEAAVGVLLPCVHVDRRGVARHLQRALTRVVVGVIAVIAPVGHGIEAVVLGPGEMAGAIEQTKAVNIGYLIQVACPIPLQDIAVAKVLIHDHPRRMHGIGSGAGKLEWEVGILHLLFLLIRPHAPFLVFEAQPSGLCVLHIHIEFALPASAVSPDKPVQFVVLVIVHVASAQTAVGGCVVMQQGDIAHFVEFVGNLLHRKVSAVFTVEVVKALQGVVLVLDM